MPKVAIRLAESAVANIEAIGDWYADQGVPEVGDQLIRETVTRVEGLADHPKMGRIVPSSTSRSCAS